MLPVGGGVKLVDFGIARHEVAEEVTRASVTGTGVIVGTPAYMTPEQLQGQAVDHRCDLFALGVVLYEAATGTHPFAGRTRATTMINILQLDPAPLASRRPLGFGPLEQIVARCLRKSPDARYPSAAALIEDLRAAERHFTGGPAPTALQPWRDQSWWWRFHQVVVAIVYGLLLVPLWLAREYLAPGAARDLMFFAGLAAAVVSIVLRLHSSFLALHARDTLAALRRRRRAVIVAADLLVLAVLSVGALLVYAIKPGLAALLLAMALGALVTLFGVEPATAAAAFPEEPEK
jgi:hypothetical protein